MKKALFFWLLLTGCKDKTPDPASQIVGSYPVYLYVIGKDTLISPEKGNLSKYPGFTMSVLREDDNTIRILYSSDRNDYGWRSLGYFKLELDNNRYRLMTSNNTMDSYSGYVDGKALMIDAAGADHTEEDWPIIRNIIAGKKDH